MNHHSPNKWKEKIRTCWNANIAKIQPIQWTTFDTYFIKNFFRSLFNSMAMFFALYFFTLIATELPDYLEEIQQNNPRATFDNIMQVFIFQIPRIIVFISPLGFLFATIYTLNYFSQNNEIIVIISSGIHLFRFTMPVIVFTLLYSFALIFFNNVVGTHYLEKSNKMKNFILLNKTDQKSYKTIESYGGNNLYYYIFKYNFKNKTMHYPIIAKMLPMEDVKQSNKKYYQKLRVKLNNLHSTPNIQSTVQNKNLDDKNPTKKKSFAQIDPKLGFQNQAKAKAKTKLQPHQNKHQNSNKNKLEHHKKQETQTSLPKNLPNPFGNLSETPPPKTISKPPWKKTTQGLNTFNLATNTIQQNSPPLSEIRIDKHSKDTFEDIAKRRTLQSPHTSSQQQVTTISKNDLHKQHVPNEQTNDNNVIAKSQPREHNTNSHVVKEIKSNGSIPTSQEKKSNNVLPKPTTWNKQNTIPIKSFQYPKDSKDAKNAESQSKLQAEKTPLMSSNKPVQTIYESLPQESIQAFPLTSFPYLWNNPKKMQETISLKKTIPPKPTVQNDLFSISPATYFLYRYDSQKASWDKKNKQWILHKGKKTEWEPSTGKLIKQTLFESLPLTESQEDPEHFSVEIANVQNLTLEECSKAIDILQKSHKKWKNIYIDCYSNKLSFPFSSFFIILACIAMFQFHSRKLLFLVSLLKSICIFILYYAIYQIGISIVKITDIFPTIIWPWSGNILFLSCCMILFRKIKT